MPTTEELMLVRIEANIKQLEREMRKASQLTDSTAKKMRKSFSGAFVGGAIGGFIGGFARQLDDIALAAVRNADALVDQADSLNLNVEALQTLQIALQKLGGNSEDAASGMRFFTKELGKAQAGEGKLASILTSAGIKLKDANGDLRSREEVFRDLIHAMSLMSNEEQRFLIATLAFGRNAAESYNNLAEAGVKAFDDIAAGAKAGGEVQEEEQARSLAGMQDEIEVFNRTVTNIWSRSIAGWVQFFQDPERAWNNMLANMKSAATTFWNFISAEWSRETTEMAANVKRVFSSAEERAGSAGTEAGRRIAEGFKQAAKAADEVADPVERISGAFETLENNTDKVKKQADAFLLLAAAKRKAEGLPAPAGTTDLVAGPGVSEGIVAPTIPDEEEIRKQEQALKDAAEAERDYVAAIAEQQEIFTDTKQGIEEQTAALETEAQALGLTAQGADELRAETELLNAANRAGLELTPELRAEIDQLAAHYGQAAEAARDAADAQQAAARLAESIGSAFEDAFVSAVTQAETLEDALKNLLKTLAELFLRLAFQRALGGLFGPSGGVAGLFGGARAMGGPVSSGRAYFVGEKGPELFMPRSAGNISPNTGVGRSAVDVHVEPSPLLVVSWEKRAVAAEESAIARGPVTARANSLRYGVP